MERKKIIDYEQLEACLSLRIAPSDFMTHDCSPLLDEDTQKRTVLVLQNIAQTNSYYVKLFTAQYMQYLERFGSVADDLYELFVEPSILNAQESPATQRDLLKYVIDKKGNTISISETPRIISGARTTGLRTWEAALYLLNYFNDSTKFRGSFKNKKVIELGAGTGLVSLSLLKNHEHHQFESITLTDGDSALLERLPETIKSNRINENVPVEINQLIWDDEEQNNDVISVDVVVAADVTYDSEEVPQLCHELARLFGGGATVAFVAATVRNAATVEVWESELEKCFTWSICETVADPHMSDMRCWFRKATPEIRVYEIRGLS